MDTEYINVYLEKLRAAYNEAINRILILETDIHFRNKLIETQVLQLSELQTALDKAAKKTPKKVEDSF
jgi:uncharacterized coiled-coil protein SlyX